jgi:23S rRNA G2069 N7-methylase RlmK/C1962 C5-methylase RlmI
LKQRVKEGRIELATMYLNFDELPDEQTLAASLAPLKQFRQHGMRAELAMQDDVNGIGWCFSEYFADAGVKYLNMGTHGHRALICFDKPTVFWWESPSGKKMLAYRAEHYNQGNFFGIHNDDFESFETKVLEYLKQLEDKHYPYDICAAQHSGYFTNRLQKNMQALKKWAVKENIFCLRLYDADLPDFNIAVDLYGDRLHVQEYAPPKTIDPEKAKKRFNLGLAAIRAVTGLNRDAIFIKTRAKQTGTNQYEKQSTASKRFIVQEGKAKILVNLTDYLDTGLFLDHRQIRLRIAKEARGKHFLNLYSYTSTASLHAALGGAASTTSVDLSNTYLNWSKENFVLNGLTVDHADEQHMFFSSDCFEWLKEGHEQYDLIFIDPPTFSNSKKFYGTFDVQRDHVSLLKRAMNRLTSDGTLYFSNNYRGFELDEEIEAIYHVEEITSETIGLDFKRNQKIHRAWKIQHNQI